MNRQILSSGTIVCLAILIYGWTQSSTSGASDYDCRNQAAKAGSSKAPNQLSSAEKHCLPKAVIATSNTTEPLFNLQWSQGGKDRLPNTMETLYSSLLEKAQALASREQFGQAIATIAGIPKNSRHYEMAQQLQEDWSRELLRQATLHCQQAQVKTAIAILQAIPETSQLHDRAVELRQLWSKQARQLNQAIAAEKVGDWQRAIDATKSLEGSLMYNSLLVQELLQQAMTKLYEPDQTLLQIATADLPTVQPADMTSLEVTSTIVD
ncbi:hypothetical protein [Leptothermofonsia sp. ETS-13]|uniref:hypothetical protein n=1 Tax=Leptothermofonsia sp. ETS-13 TaxID=3035696 RepID=UPI003BA1F243